MERRFGRGFASVRIHSSDGAARLAHDIGARAFTVESDVFFGAGAYRAGTTSGRRLLAHELAHTVQQGGGQATQQRLPGISASPAGRAQRAMICSKRLEAPVVGWFANHAYIDDTGRNDCRGSGLAGNFAIQQLSSGNFIKGCAVKTDTSSDPQSHTPNAKPCRPKSGVRDVSACLRNAFNAYANPSEYRNPRGPNSNTFAFTLAKTCCADSSDSGLGLVPGWGRAAAGPCPTRTTFTPRYMGGGAVLGEDGIVRQGPGMKL